MRKIILFVFFYFLAVVATRGQMLYKIAQTAVFDQDGHPQSKDFQSGSGFLVVDDGKISVYDLNFQKIFDLSSPMLDIKNTGTLRFNGKGRIKRSNAYYIFEAGEINPGGTMLKIVQPLRNLSITYKLDDLERSVISYSVLKGLLVSGK